MNKISCPKCNSKNIIPIIYGYPTKKLFEASNNDECILGGCCIPINEPSSSLKNNHCKDCSFEW